eukprot:TRINITY_DN7332_c0_g1_i1.p1 TRINITY_DN7332_c0_g1~~TRINITY_DN7332_c0_g1_i1.p1  ORF type:complete len:400 (+),score=48.97 TRINITY_DN7332_c0_g1_i1:415-1614(+)
MQVATRYGLECKSLLELNSKHYSGLRPRSELEEGTAFVVPPYGAPEQMASSNQKSNQSNPVAGTSGEQPALKRAKRQPAAKRKHKDRVCEVSIGSATKEGAKGTGKKLCNQDAACAELVDDGLWCCGVFDGHGALGEVAAQLCACTVPLLCERAARRAHPRDQILASALSQVDQTLKMVIERENMYINQHKPGYCMDYGTTALVALVQAPQGGLPPSMWLAWAGDSQALLFEGKFGCEPTVRVLTSQHRAGDPAVCGESMRVSRAGGTLEYNHGWRVFPGDKRPRTSRAQGPGSLAVTRSLGHPEFSKHGVIPTPELSVTDLRTHDLDYSICVLATDGITDELSGAQVGRIVAGFTTQCSECVDVSALAQSIVDSAALAPDSDDATVAIIVVQHVDCKA